jgi:hypothetical protein
MAEWTTGMILTLMIVVGLAVVFAVGALRVASAAVIALLKPDSRELLGALGEQDLMYRLSEDGDRASLWVIDFWRGLRLAQRDAFCEHLEREAERLWLSLETERDGDTLAVTVSGLSGSPVAPEELLRDLVGGARLRPFDGEAAAAPPARGEAHLRALLGSENPDEVERALRAIAGGAAPGLAPLAAARAAAIVDELAESDPMSWGDHRWLMALAAVRALGVLEDPGAEPALLVALGVDSPQVVEDAARGLRRAGGRASLEPLGALAGSGVNPALQRVAGDSLDAVVRRIEQAGEIALLEALPLEQEVALRAVIAALGRSGGAESVPLLRAVLGGDRGEGFATRRAARAALEAIRAREHQACGALSLSGGEAGGEVSLAGSGADGALSLSTSRQRGGEVEGG